MQSVLTPRQEQVMRLLIDGKRDGEIALILSISLRTVRWHIGNTCHKLNAETRVQAAVMLASILENEKFINVSCDVGKQRMLVEL
jgi:DNA-binding CsgD family transcriptional regulator